LPHQPIFYPVLSEGYATQIARDWNTKDEASDFTGYVLRFNVLEEFLSDYEIHTVGDSRHQEYWIPAADLEEFNHHIVGTIQIVAVHRRLRNCEGGPTVTINFLLCSVSLCLCGEIALCLSPKPSILPFSA
jgi:hypothetical protein